MEFDKSKILTVATAEHFKDGQLGWANDRVNWLEAEVLNSEPYVVRESTDLVYRGDFPFISCDYTHRRYFYPAPEPTYRPFNEDELNDLVGKIVRNKQTGYRKLVTGKPTTSLGVNLEGKYINAKDLLNSFMMDDGKSPCGIKEEA